MDFNMLKPRRVIRPGTISPFKWNGSDLGTLDPDQYREIDDVKIGRSFKLCYLIIKGYVKKALVKTVDSVLPAIFDELKPVFSLPKIGTHTFRMKGKLYLALRPLEEKGKVFLDSTLDLAPSRIKQTIQEQVRLTLAFREIFGITDTLERSLVLRGTNPVQVISFLEPGTVAGNEDGCNSILPQTVTTQWFSITDPTLSVERTIADLICLNRDAPESTFAYYRPLIEEVVTRIDSTLITYVDLFLDRLGLYLPY